MTDTPTPGDEISAATTAALERLDPDPPSTPPPVHNSATHRPGVIHVWRDDAGMWRWVLIAANGERILGSTEGYVHRSHAVEQAAEEAVLRRCELTIHAIGAKP